MGLAESWVRLNRLPVSNSFSILPTAPSQAAPTCLSSNSFNICDGHGNIVAHLHYFHPNIRKVEEAVVTCNIYYGLD